MAARVAELVADGVPFVHATVVRAQPPTSARPGDDAVVLADGSIEGFVGGHCAEESVRAASIDALESGEALLLRVLPEGAESYPEGAGARSLVNPCLSGGALEIFLEPLLPARTLTIVGETPIADALAALAEPVGFVFESVRSLAGSPPTPDAVAVIISSHGRDEAESIQAALDAGVGFVGLVASARRGQAVLDAMGLTEPERARVRTPVGLEIGARTPEEIALSILAQVVQAVRLEGLEASGGGAVSAASVRPAQAVDPVCGMTVVVSPDTPHLVSRGVDVWFCSTSCRDRYAV